MKLIVKSSFTDSISKFPDVIQFKVIEIFEVLERMKDISELKSESLVGFPYYHKIELKIIVFSFI